MITRKDVLEQIIFLLLFGSTALYGQKSFSFTKVREENAIDVREVVLLLDTTGSAQNAQTLVDLGNKLTAELSALGISSFIHFRGDPGLPKDPLILFFWPLPDNEVVLNRFVFDSFIGSGLRYCYRYKIKQLNHIPEGFWQIWTTLSIWQEKPDKGSTQAASALAEMIDRALIKPAP